MKISKQERSAMNQEQKQEKAEETRAKLKNSMLIINLFCKEFLQNFPRTVRFAKKNNAINFLSFINGEESPAIVNQHHYVILSGKEIKDLITIAKCKDFHFFQIDQIPSGTLRHTIECSEFCWAEFASIFINFHFCCFLKFLFFSFIRIQNSLKHYGQKTFVDTGMDQQEFDETKTSITNFVDCSEMYKVHSPGHGLFVHESVKNDIWNDGTTYCVSFRTVQRCKFPLLFFHNSLILTPNFSVS